MEKKRKEEYDYLVTRFVDELKKYELALEGSFGVFKLKAKVYYKEREK